MYPFMSMNINFKGPTASDDTAILKKKVAHYEINNLKTHDTIAQGHNSDT